MISIDLMIHSLFFYAVDWFMETFWEFLAEDALLDGFFPFRLFISCRALFRLSVIMAL